MMPTPADIIFAVLFAVVIAGFEAAYFNKKFKKSVAEGVIDARPRAYRRALIGQWTIAAVAIALWVYEGRPWHDLGLTPPSGWRLVAGISVIAAMLAFTVNQLFTIRRLSPEGMETVRRRVSELEFLLPHSRGEFRWFIALSITAGVCEELLYRGFLTWLAVAYVGLPAGITLVVLAFGIAHAYQGRKGVVKTGLVGLVMSLIVVASGWIIPAMVVHALVDCSAGVLGLKLLGGSSVPTHRDDGIDTHGAPHRDRTGEQRNAEQ
jgi:membrane protease YdiL (CAAX protease family)